MDKRDNRPGFMVRTLNNILKRQMDEDTEKIAGGTTMIQRWVLGYLSHNDDHDIYQKELEKNLNIGKSTLTEVLNVMEKNNMVERQSSTEDARCKKIILTDKSRKFHKVIESSIMNTEDKLVEGLTQEDIDNFMRIIHKMIDNMQDKDKETKKDD